MFELLPLQSLEIRLSAEAMPMNKMMATTIIFFIYKTKLKINNYSNAINRKIEDSKEKAFKKLKKLTIEQRQNQKNKMQKLN